MRPRVWTPLDSTRANTSIVIAPNATPRIATPWQGIERFAAILGMPPQLD